MGYLYTILPYTNPGISMPLLEVMRQNLPTIYRDEDFMTTKARADIFQKFFSHKISAIANELDVIKDAYYSGNATTFLQLMLVRFRYDDNMKWIMCGQELYNVHFMCEFEQGTKLLVSIVFTTFDATIQPGTQLIVTIDNEDPALVLPENVTEGQKSYSRILTFGDIVNETQVGLGTYASNNLDYRALLRADLIAHIPTYNGGGQLISVAILDVIKANGYGIHHVDVYSIDDWNHNGIMERVVNYRSRHHLIMTCNGHMLGLFKECSDPDKYDEAVAFSIDNFDNGLIVVPDYQKGSLENAVFLNVVPHGEEVDAFWDFESGNARTDPSKLKGLIVAGEL